MNDFLRGALAIAALSIGLLFMRSWRVMRDRLFMMFSAAFWLLGLNWILVTLTPALAWHANMLRFAAFVVIAFAVMDKNRRKEALR